MSISATARRRFLARVLRGASLAATGGLVWGLLLRQQGAAAAYALRPPGARHDPGSDFEARCIKCGQCARACPYDTLRMATAGEAVPIGTPYFVPRETPCYLCPDIPCAAACPTGALDPALADVADARMGLAVIDHESCLSWQGLRCEICHRECPLRDTAIGVEHHPRRLSRHAVFVPVVHSEACTGCGICEQACPTEIPAIRVVPPRLVKGRMGAHYRLGWREPPPDSRGPPPAPAEAPADVVPGLDYLNEGGP